MKREVRILLSLVAVGSLLSVVPAQAATKISSFGYVIAAPGVYQVTEDLSGSGNAITVLADNVDLHLNGHTLSGDGFSGAGVAVEGRAKVSIRHGTVQGFAAGIFLNGALDCKVSSVTARGNANQGIFLSNATGNLVTDNTASQFGDGAGIHLEASRGNTVSRNTTNQNYNGIRVGDSSFGNTVSRNTVTGNRGQGIQLINDATQNTIQDNTVSGSGEIGIAVGIFGFGGVSRNVIQGNTVTLSPRGIVIELAFPQNTGNILQRNTALTNALVDLEDDNPGCDSNLWVDNKFETDLVAGVPDSGPGGGCIR